MILVLCSASNLRARAEKIKKLLFKQTHKVTFHIIASLGVVLSLSTLISKLSGAKIIGIFKIACFSLIGWFNCDQLKWAALEKSWFSGRRYFSRLRRQISIDYIKTAPPPNLTLLLQYRQLRRLLAQRATQQAIFDNQRQPVHGSEQSSKFVSEISEQVRSNLFYSPQFYSSVLQRNATRSLFNQKSPRWSRRHRRPIWW